MVNCIKCLNNPALVSGQYLWYFLLRLWKKLDAVIQTRDALIEAIIMAIASNNIFIVPLISQPLFRVEYGFKGMEKAFNCDGKIRRVQRKA
jgi:hypothetical protein